VPAAILRHQMREIHHPAGHPHHAARWRATALACFS
jgi:hypothetical protein